MDGHSDDLSVGVLAAIVFGGVTGLVFLFILTICVCNACRKKLEEEDDLPQSPKPLRSQGELSNVPGDRIPTSSGCVNYGFVMPSAPSRAVDDNNEAPPSYHDVITGNI